MGAGTGNYEPKDREVVAVEPSLVMLHQRAANAAPAVQATAEALPIPDECFDAALAILTVHHWTDPDAGLAELRRVARRQVVVTFDPEVSTRFWLHRDYLPALADRERSLPSLAHAHDALGGDVRVLAVPRDCTDGFLGAHWARPEAHLEAARTGSMSGLALLAPEVLGPAMARLASDLADGTWARRNAELEERSELDCGYRLVVAGPASRVEAKPELT